MDPAGGGVHSILIPSPSITDASQDLFLCPLNFIGVPSFERQLWRKAESGL